LSITRRHRHRSYPSSASPPRRVSKFPSDDDESTTARVIAPHRPRPRRDIRVDRASTVRETDIHVARDPSSTSSRRRPAAARARIRGGRRLRATTDAFESTGRRRRAVALDVGVGVESVVVIDASRTRRRRRRRRR
jgi:hypothetical protein|tara:strand:+ start:5963 stop:6370 length:408 start_codon:yes stop_codon:yes gene_type:complete